MEVFRFVKVYLKKKYISSIIYVVCTIVLNITTILIPVVTGGFIDNLISSPSTKTIHRYVILLILLMFFQLILNFVIQIFEVKLIAKVIFEVNNSLILHLKKIPLSKLNEYNIANLTQRNNNDSSTVVNFVFHSLISLLSNIVTLFFCFIIISYIELKISMLILGFIVIYVLFYRMIKQKIYISQRKYKDMTSIYFSDMYDQLSKVKIIKLYDLYKKTSESLYKSFKNFQTVYYNFTMISYFFGSGDAILYTTAQIIIFIFGGYAVLSGQMSIGVFTIVLSYGGTILSSIKSLSNYIKKYIDAKVSFSRMKELFSIDEVLIGKNKLAEPINSIEVKSLTYAFNNQPLFNDLSLNFKKGNIYCLIGRNGCGKSTLLDIISYVIPTSNEVLYNNIPLKSLDIQNLYVNHISYLTQESVLFKDTIYENIALNSIDDIQKVWNLFEIDKVNYENSKYVNYENDFSGGEEKKICLIRTLSKPYDLLLLDEPTNHLDINSRNNLIDYLLAIKNEKIIIISSHDDKVINCSDYIIDLSKTNKVRFIKNKS